MLKCPACGAGLVENLGVCTFCGSRLVYEAYGRPGGNSLEQKTVCSIEEIRGSLQRKLYENAQKMCEELCRENPLDFRVYYYLCISVLAGKKPFLQSRKTIETCVDLLDKALTCKEDACVYLLRAYIEHDYFERKFLNRNPNYKFYYEKANAIGINPEDREELEVFINTKITL